MCVSVSVHVRVSGCGISGVILCSRDTASRDHAFPSGLLAMPTMVLKTPSWSMCTQS